jgi:hypothetical protein
MFNLDPPKLLTYLKSQLTYLTVKKKKKNLKSQNTHIPGPPPLLLAPRRSSSTPLPLDLFHSFFLSLVESLGKCYLKYILKFECLLTWFLLIMSLLTLFCCCVCVDLMWYFECLCGVGGKHVSVCVVWFVIFYLFIY